jgi:membrane-associated HD superfamily phosphohydrolase
LNKISLIRRERQAAKTIIESTSTTTHFYQRQPPVYDAQQDSSDATSENFEKILSTIQDIKRSLEDQSVELCELNESDN